MRFVLIILAAMLLNSAEAKVKFIRVKQIKTWERMLQLAKENGKTLLV